MTDRPLQLDDIQGNVLGGFNTDYQALIALTVRDPVDFPRAAKWLSDQAPSVTVASEVLSGRTAMKVAAGPSPTWLCIAVGARFLKAARPEVLIRDQAFNDGMLRRAPSMLNDKTDPAQWRVGGSAAVVDVMLIVASNDEPSIAARADALCADAAATGLTTTYRETARRLDDKEHFGFRDGVSQPKVAGYDDDPAGALCAGHFVFGYPKEVGGPPFSPVVDEKGLTDNGSLLVFRRLAQNVQAFRTYVAEEAARISPEWPGMSHEHLAALIVGRWPSGAPVKSGQTKDPGTASPDNSFNFLDDAQGASCPFGAHIRKVNPRAGKKDVVEVPRMLRRGIPFGPLFDSRPEETDRGLCFMAFQSSIKEQFEFLTQHWMNDRQNPAPGNDLLVGRSNDVRRMEILGPAGPVEVRAAELQWIVPTGGAYLFAPGRSGLAKFGAPAVPFGLWKLKQLWARTADSIALSFE